MEVVYGIEVAEKGDPYIAIATEVMHSLSVAALPGAFMVDTFTFCTCA
jgi:hypothetical protein